MKNRFAKKLITSILAASSAAMILAGCGSASATPVSTDTASDSAQESVKTDYPTVNIVLTTLGTHAEPAGIARVEAALNEILNEKAGANVKLTFNEFGNHDNQVSMMLTSADELDIAYIMASPNTFIENGQLLDLTQYIDSELGQAIKDELGETFVEANRKADGNIYYLPNKRDRSIEMTFMANKEMYLGLGYEIDDSKIWTLDEIHDMVKASVEKYPNTYGVAPMSGSQVMNVMMYDNLGDNYNIGVVENCGSTGKVVSITECKEWVDFSRMMRKWYNEGLVMPDFLSNTESNLMNEGKCFGNFLSGACPDGMEAEDSKRVLLSISQNFLPSYAAEGMGYIINAMTKHPDEAFKVLRELYINEDVKRLISFGVEGEDYVVSEDGLYALYPDGVDGNTAEYNIGMQNWWIMANGQCTIVPTSQAPDYWELTRQYDARAIQNPLVGCVFDNSDVKDEYAACMNVYAKYFDAIMCGSMDTDEGLALYSQELKAAGEDAVIAAKQAQVDAFLASRGE